MPWSTAGRNLRADATAALIDAVSLHTDDPGAAGAANEWSGGGYSRESPTFAAADGGAVALTAPLDFTGPAETPAAWAGLWGAGGVFLGAAARTSGDAAANAAGEYTIGSMTITADGNIT